MAPLDTRKQARVVAKADHIASEKAIAQHILNRRNNDLANPPLELPPINPLPSQKLASTKEANRVATQVATNKAKAKDKIEADIASKVVANAGAVKPPVSAPVWMPNTSTEG